MQDQLQEYDNEFSENIEGVITVPASGYLYTLNDDAEKLGENKKKVFHSVTAKLLYITK